MFHKIVLFFIENSLKAKGMNKLILQEEINIHNLWQYTDVTRNSYVN